MAGTSPEYSRKRSGAYVPPDDVSAALVAWARRGAGDRMLDPSWGDGRFLALQGNSVSIERNSPYARRAIEHAPGALVHEGGFFAQAKATGERFEFAAGNPPFIRYKTFTGNVRGCALALCEALGVRFSGLSSS